jgi:hypothetical protein
LGKASATPDRRHSGNANGSDEQLQTEWNPDPVGIRDPRAIPDGKEFEDGDSPN